MTKPINNSGMMCPLWRKDVKKVCHKCHLYQPLDVSDRDNKAYTHWDCSFNLAIIISRDTGGIMDGMQRAIESLRNQVSKAQQLSKQLHTERMLTNAPRNPDT